MNDTKITPAEIRGDELSELDFVAFLSALGFPILSRRRIRRYNLGTGAEDKLVGLWTVGSTDPAGRHTLSRLRGLWAAGVPSHRTTGGEADLVDTARLTLHNFRALQQLIHHGADGCELYAVNLGNATRLNNERSFPGCVLVSELLPGSPAAALPPTGTACAAAALAVGCRLCGYRRELGQYKWLLSKGSAPMADPDFVRKSWNDSAWLLDPKNESPLAVAAMTLKNRRELISDVYRPKELTLLHRMEHNGNSGSGDLALIDPANARHIEAAEKTLSL